MKYDKDIFFWLGELFFKPCMIDSCPLPIHGQVLVNLEYVLWDLDNVIRVSLSS